MMMKIHKEGKNIVLLTVLLAIFLAFLALSVFPGHWLLYAFLIFLFFSVFGVLYFFRSPNREVRLDEAAVISPADGKVVVAEKITEEEVFGRPMQQISIFMSPLNVHLNRFPTDGKISRYVYHPGKYLLAWNPKSSLLNERNTIVVETPRGIQYMLRQIAGTLARRIVCYCREGMQVKQGEELGFIKFGSRVDVFLPAETEILVKPGDRVRGGISTLARFRF